MELKEQTLIRPAEIHLKVHEIPLVGVDHDFPRLQYLEVLFD